MERFQRITQQALELFEDETETQRWFSSAKDGLDGQTPQEALATDAGSKQVEELLYRADIRDVWLMQVWRLCKQKHHDTAFSGEGGLYASGRWHPKGLPIVYTASSLALATLEVFAHTESNQIPLVAIRAYFSDDLSIETVRTEDLPANWQEVSAYTSLELLGNKLKILETLTW